ncbi:thioredoxin family protein [Flavobacterium sp.]|uniref:thioredoxin family protein n=1 Tax=Flavobacterium sp. TaxID=239 RepID=UPI00262095E2|nr:thioredoxin family protein [Flavobacterium sp.]MDD3005516.1 thioredoxin family protein [Flavobacterium sp.]
MKKLTYIAMFFLFITHVQAQELTWHTDVNKASEIAVKNKKPLLLFFTGSDWCGWCIRLQKEVFTQAEFIAWAKEKVVLVDLDFPRRKQLSPELTKQNNELQQLFGVRGYPTVWFVKPTMVDKKVSLDRLGSTGYVAGGPQAWLSNANSIIDKK